MMTLGQGEVGQEALKSQLYLRAYTSEVCIPGAQASGKSQVDIISHDLSHPMDFPVGPQRL